MFTYHFKLLKQYVMCNKTSPLFNANRNNDNKLGGGPIDRPPIIKADMGPK